MSLEPGSTFGPYTIVASLGRGGMAVVVRAHDPALDRQVALKVLSPELLHDPTFAGRFQQEARLAARLEHQHILPVHAFGIEQGHPWMAMRLVSGGSLADRLRRGPLAPQDAATVLAEVASALDYAHAHGVVHRDVKPANVLLDDAGHAYLADFGIARMAEGSAVATATGVVQGTPAYMAPEQALGTKVDGRADVYALGVMAFECLTGRVPYTGSTPVAILMKHVSEPVPEPSPAEVAAPLTPVLRRCLAKKPAERWPTAGSFAQALTAASRALTDPGATPPTLPTLALPDDAAASTAVAGPASRGAPALRSARAWAAVGGAIAVVVMLTAAMAAVRLLSPPASVPAPATPPVAPPATPVASPATPVSPPAAAARPMPPAPSPAAPATLPPVPVRRPAQGETQAGSSGAAAEPGTTRTRPSDLPARLRVYCEPSLEPVLFRNTEPKDVGDSVRDLREALTKKGQVEVVTSRAQSDAVVQVLERGREPARIGMRKVRVRVSMAGESIELVGQDSMTGFNTWSGAAGGTARQVEAWLARRLPAARP